MQCSNFVVIITILQACGIDASILKAHKSSKRYINVKQLKLHFNIIKKYLCQVALNKELKVHSELHLKCIPFFLCRDVHAFQLSEVCFLQLSFLFKVNLGEFLSNYLQNDAFNVINKLCPLLFYYFSYFYKNMSEINIIL